MTTSTRTRKPKKPIVTNRRIVGINKAGQYAGVSRWTIRAWILAGKLPYVQYPGKEGEMRGAKVDLDDLDRLIESSKACNG